MILLYQISTREFDTFLLNKSIKPLILLGFHVKFSKKVLRVISKPLIVCVKQILYIFVYRSIILSVPLFSNDYRFFLKNLFLLKRHVFQKRVFLTLSKCFPFQLSNSGLYQISTEKSNLCKLFLFQKNQKKHIKYVKMLATKQTN